MIGRNAVLFSHAPITLAVVAGIGAATALMAGTIGLVQNDIKRVLAYSTVSQLGYMFLAMGVGAFARRHLPSLHARVLQGAAVPRIGRGHPRAGRRAGPAQHGRAEEGSADHLLDVPDRRAGDRGRAAALPGSSARTRSCSGRSRRPTRSLCCGASASVTSLLTATYMFRLVFLAFHGERRHGAHASAHPEEEEPAAHAAHGHARAHAHRDAPRRTGITLHDAPPSMAIPLIVLAIGSVFAGYVGVPHALGGSQPDRAVPRAELRGCADEPDDRSLGSAVGAIGGVRTVAVQETHATSESAGEHASTELMLMAVSSGVAVAGIGIAVLFLAAEPRGRRRHGDAHARPLHAAACTSTTSTSCTTPPSCSRSSCFQPAGLWKGVDAGVIDGAVNGVGQAVRAASSVLRRAADRIGPDLRGVALSRRRADSRLVPVLKT